MYPNSMFGGLQAGAGANANALPVSLGMSTGALGAAATMPGMAGMGAGGLGQAAGSQANAGSAAALQSNPALAAMASNPAALQQVQAAYQQYAMRVAAYQRMIASMGGMQAGMQGAMQPGMGMPGAMPGAMQQQPGMQAPGGQAGMAMQGAMGAQAGANPMAAMGAMMPGAMGHIGAMGAMGGGMMPPPRPMAPAGPGPMHRAGPPPPMGPDQGQQGNPGVYYKTRICNKWKEGTCPYGETCRYAHGDHDLRKPGDPIRVPGAGNQRPGVPGPAPPADKRTAIDMMRKTRLCEEFVKTGKCRYGDKCTFAHGEHELRQPQRDGAQQQAAQQGQQQTPRPELHKTRLCDRFMNTGNCPYGDKCTFAHGAHELKQRGAQPSGPTGGARPSGPRPMGPGAAPAGGAMAAGAKRPREDDSSELDASKRANTFGGDPSQAQDHEQQQQQSDDPQQQLDGVVKDEYGLGGDDNGDGDGGAGAGEDEQYRDHEQHVEGGAEGAAGGAAGDGDEHECAMCAKLMKQGKQKLLQSIQALTNPAAQRLGVMILGMAPSLDMLWHRLTPTALAPMLDKPDFTIKDKVDLLRTLSFHSHLSPEQREGLESEKYVAQGLLPDVADFVHLCNAGKEGSASMQEYFDTLEACKALYTVDDERYFTMSSTIASVMLT